MNPTTAAGKRLLAEYYGPERAETRLPSDQYFVLAAKIAAIEAEAVAVERARIRTAVRGLPPLWAVGESPDHWIERAAVLAIINPEEDDHD